MWEVLVVCKWGMAVLGSVLVTDGRCGRCVSEGWHMREMCK